MTAVVDQLIALFNSRSLDLPDGVFSRHTQFLLNGVPFENMLGRAPADPLVLMLARGPAGYRFVLKALQHAVPDAVITRGELDELQHQGRNLTRGQCWLSGHLRGTGEAVELLIGFELTAKGTTVERAAATLDEPTLAKVRDARFRE